ncbi:MAG: hypothetical protein ABI778_10050 [Ignavibacteriota bacterium]
MTKQLSSSFMLLAIVLLFASCDSTVTNVAVQDIVELRWQNDGAALYGYIQNYTQTINSAIPFTGYSIAKFNADGSLAKTYDFDQKSRPDFSPSLFVLGDGSSAVTQLENDLFRYDLKNSAATKLQQMFHLILVSPDLHYVVGTPSPAIQPIKTVVIYDITSSPIRKVAQFDTAIVSASGIWLSNGTFAITCPDSIGSHIAIYDTAGVLRQTIGGAETSFHNVVYHEQTNELFFRNRSLTSADHTVDKVNLTTMARANILTDSTDNFDITRDGNVIIFSKYLDGEKLYSKNILSGNTLSIADDIRLIVALSPSEDKIAYIRRRDDNFTEVKVIPFTRP